MSDEAVRIPRLHAGQQRVVDEAARFNVLYCGRRFGKTVLGRERASRVLLDGGKVAWLAPDYTYLDRPWQDLKSALAPAVDRVSEQKRKMWLRTGGELHCYTLDKPEPARGEHFDLVIVDEAAIAPKLRRQWPSSIRPTLVDRRGEAWFLTTPQGRNFAHELFERGQSRDRVEWKSWRMPSWENPHVPRDEIEAQRGQLPDWIFAQEYEAVPADEGGNPFGLSALASSWGLDDPGTPIVYGVDLAKSVDFTWVIGLDRSGQVVVSERWQGEPWDVTIRRIAELVRGVPTLVDSTGVGDPIVEALQREGLPVAGFRFTSSSKQTLLEGLSLAFQRGQLRHADERLRAELEIFGYEVRSGSVRYSAPSGSHDDGVMALALAVHHGREHGLWAARQDNAWQAPKSTAARDGARLRDLL